MNGSNIKNTGKYAVAGGNEEIIHLCEQNHSTFKNAYETAIIFHRNDIFKYLIEKQFQILNENKQQNIETKLKDLENLEKLCINNGNYELLSFLVEEGMDVNCNIINESANIGNLYLVKHFLQNKQIPKDILVFSLESGNNELLNYLLKLEGININGANI